MEHNRSCGLCSYIYAEMFAIRKRGYVCVVNSVFTKYTIYNYLRAYSEVCYV